MKNSVLFVCIHNSARSQMAEAWLRHFCSEVFEAYSAGLESGTLNPIAVEAMAEAGIDISKAQTKTISDIVRSGRLFDFVVTVCDESSAERCPIFPSVTTRLHWGFPDPSALSGTHEEKLTETIRIRDLIRARIES